MQQLTQNINDRRYFFFSFFKSQSAAVNCIWKRWRRRFYCLKSRLFVARVNGSRAVPLTAFHVVVKSKLNGLTGYVCYTPLNFLHQKNSASFCYIDFFIFSSSSRRESFAKNVLFFFFFSIDQFFERFLKRMLERNWGLSVQTKWRKLQEEGLRIKL